MKKPLLFSLLSILIFLLGSEVRASVDEVPEIPREFRAVWIATVANIDWPSNQNLSTEEQKAELIELLDLAAATNLNAVIFQVRPMFDALYQSDLEPWSEYLTGKMGQAPEPYYDPLAFIVEEAHKRGLELHAWFNPYRARYGSAKSEISENHVSQTHPEIVRQYGNFLWADPAEEQTKRMTLDVILDVAKRYDVDGVHIDDYFYPYRSYGGGADFPDDGPWKEYQEAGGDLSRSDWRRQHVNDFVERFYREVKEQSPLVKVGISPFGIWRPGHPEGIAGMDQYEALYADAKLWLNEGWVDYYTPQLYWEMAREQQSYVRLLEWWVQQNHENRHMWPGNHTNRISNSNSSWDPEEINNQIAATRAQEGATGNVHFSGRAFKRNHQNVIDRLRSGPYAEQALVPASPWLKETPPEKPILSLEADDSSGGFIANWESGDSEDPFLWVIYLKENDEWSWQILPAKSDENRKFNVGNATEIAVSAIDRAGNESERTWKAIP
ncbi:MAG TPA: family 10 glycosylhydrolase [Opitutales bacterium]|nr:family 10 glycosylhydrolase [Opitutales bacterium]